jgi:hypothetical protein
LAKPLDPPSLKPEIEMRPPDQIIASSTNLAQRLASQLKPSIENIELNNTDPKDFIASGNLASDSINPTKILATQTMKAFAHKRNLCRHKRTYI